MQPLLVRTIITYSEEEKESRNIAKGIWMAIGLFMLSNIQNFGQQHVSVSSIA